MGRDLTINHLPPELSKTLQNTEKKKKSGGNSFFFGTIMLAKKIGIHNIMQIKISPQLLKWHKNTKIWKVSLYL